MGQTDIRCGLVARKFDLSKDYVTLRKWWCAHNSFPPKGEHLSTTGVVVEVEGKPVCAGFLYNTDSKIGVFEFVVSDPEADKKIRCNALNCLIKSIQEIAKRREYSLIYTSVNIGAYISKLKDAGFLVVDKNQTHLFYEVDNE